MFKAQKEMLSSMPGVSVIIEVLDARIPFSSENPLVSKLRGDKPCIKVLNKRDLADPIRTAEWVRHLEKDKYVRALPLNSKDSREMDDLKRLVSSHMPLVTGKKVPTAMIIGIPNVGKSTLINCLAGKIICKTGNVPAVTKAQQFIRVSPSLHLLDTPGILWPKLDPLECAYRLAITGAIKDTAFDYNTIGPFACRFLLRDYCQMLADTYSEKITSELDPDMLLELIATRRGCYVKGGMLDTAKALEVMIRDLRKGTLGKITLETPEMIKIEDGEAGKLEGVKGMAGRLERKRLKKNPDRETLLYTTG